MSLYLEKQTTGLWNTGYLVQHVNASIRFLMNDDMKSCPSQEEQPGQPGTPLQRKQAPSQGTLPPCKEAPIRVTWSARTSRLHVNRALTWETTTSNCSKSSQMKAIVVLLFVVFVKSLLYLTFFFPILPVYVNSHLTYCNTVRILIIYQFLVTWKNKAKIGK